MTLPHVYQERGKSWTRDYKPDRKQKLSFVEKFRIFLRKLAIALVIIVIAQIFTFIILKGIDQEAKTQGITYEASAD